MGITWKSKDFAREQEKRPRRLHLSVEQGEQDLIGQVLMAITTVLWLVTAPVQEQAVIWNAKSKIHVGMVQLLSP